LIEKKSIELSLEQAQEILKEANATRLEACQQEMSQVLKKHGCALQAEILVTNDGRLTARVAIVPAG
jgi:hypothetical protein